MASQLEGVAEAYAKLRALGDVAEAKALRAAVRAAAKPIFYEMEASAPEGSRIHRTYKGRLVAPGFLKRNLRFVVTRIKQAGVIQAIFGARKEAYYGPQFVERGTVKQAAQAFMVPALESTKDESLDAFTSTLLDQVKKALNKAGS